jgi:Domain of unknown function (DUF5916)/Carbohydrate family 9 binding domain-like
MRGVLLMAAAAAVVLFCPLSVLAQDGSMAAGLVIDGPPPPEPPEMISRDKAGQATVRAIRLTAPLKVDGKLDEGVYTEYKPFGDFMQVAPQYLVPATERTEVWVMFDANYIYVAAKMWDAHPPEEWVSNELRRDTNQLRENDHFGVMFDTFYDRRNGFVFYTNPLGALADYTVVDEGGPNKDWNPVWESRPGRFEGGWTVEMAIPFKTLRYKSGANQVWGMQLRRNIRHKNEWNYLTPVPRNIAGPQAFNRISTGGTLVGLDLPPASKNIELKPYAIARTETDHLRRPPVSNDFDSTGGIDVKYGVTANLTADFTANTDFAQVEIDEQQVNLTRFNLFFPEKRDFFLEGRGIFDFARGGAGAFGTGTDPSAAQNSDTPTLFYSRRIGLSGSRVVPIDVGGRLTGKVGAFSVGVVNIQTGELDAAEAQLAEPATNFTVLRAKRDILRRSTIGAIYTNRSQSTVPTVDGASQAGGVDAAFSFYQNLSMSAYYAKTGYAGSGVPTRLRGDNDSYQAKFDWLPDRYGVRGEYLKVGQNFNPEVGYTRRTDFTKTFGSLRFSPRPKSTAIVRKYTFQADLEYFENGAGQLESRKQTGRFAIEFDNSDRFAFDVNDYFELLLHPFALPVKRSVVIPRGSYDYVDYIASYTFGTQRPVSGTLSLQQGQFYDGDITTITLSTARVSVLKQFSLEPRMTINRVDLPEGKFTAKQYGSRFDYGFSPRTFASALLQYSSSDRTFSSNLRFRWEYRPGSELFVVWTDEHDTWQARPDTRLRSRAFVVKITRLLQF